MSEPQHEMGTVIVFPARYPGPELPIPNDVREAVFLAKETQVLDALKRAGGFFESTIPIEDDGSPTRFCIAAHPSQRAQEDRWHFRFPDLLISMSCPKGGGYDDFRFQVLHERGDDERRRRNLWPAEYEMIADALNVTSVGLPKDPRYALFVPQYPYQHDISESIPEQEAEEVLEHNPRQPRRWFGRAALQLLRRAH